MGHGRTLLGLKNKNKLASVIKAASAGPRGDYGEENHRAPCQSTDSAETA